MVLYSYDRTRSVVKRLLLLTSPKLVNSAPRPLESVCASILDLRMTIRWAINKGGEWAYCCSCRSSQTSMFCKQSVLSHGNR
jgi:hypothetical protein